MYRLSAPADKIPDISGQAGFKTGAKRRNGTQICVPYE